MITVRRFADADAPTLWALNDLPNIGSGAACCLCELHLDTATNQPEAMAFYRSLDYQEVGRKHRPGWSWTLVYYAKRL